MKAIDQAAILDYGIPRLALMENAGRGVAEVAMDLVRRGGFPAPCVFILCGSGNNGGDGMVAARYLQNKGRKVQIALLGLPERLKEDAKIQFQIISKMKIPYQEIKEPLDAPRLITQIRNSSLVLDAVFGVGLDRPVSDFYKKIFELINQSMANVLSVDLPSGIHADTGQIMGAALKAKVTATLALPKKGLFEGKGPEYAGRICVVDIGIPRELL